MMKPYIFIILVIFLNPIISYSQADEAARGHLTEAKDSFKAEDYENARFTLQQALSEVYVLVGQEVLKILPQSMENLQSNPANDNVTSNPIGISGVNVHRSYGDENRDASYASVDLISNSPFLTMVNSFLTNPLFMNKADGSQKVVKINNYKSLLKKEENADGRVDQYEIQIPMGSSLLTMVFSGFADETTVLKMANLVDIKRISQLVEGR